MTPLSQACSYGHCDVVSFLAEKRANPHLAHLSPMHSACHGSSVPILRLLIRVGYGINLPDKVNVAPVLNLTSLISHDNPLGWQHPFDGCVSQRQQRKLDPGAA
jgi:ankyrin repeat protein